ncbi:MAG: hypothetical protein KatS3mg047_1250 [Bellilinea sp.]|nr:MAG: hypothetical protein KatS3mg047_1250 [Bellilinea sp.]
MMKRLHSVQNSTQSKDAQIYSFRQPLGLSRHETMLNEPVFKESGMTKKIQFNIPAILEDNWFGPRIWKSKLYDGILPALVMILLALLFKLLFIPVEVMFGIPGLLIYTLIFLAGGVYSLGKSVQMRFDEITRAWYGLIAGLSLWFAVETAGHLGESSFSIEVEAVMLLLAVLVTTTLWKTVFPLGVRFLAFVFLVEWTLRFWLGLHALLAGSFTFFQWSYYLSGFIALSSLIFFLLWMFFKAESRVHHLWSAVGVWFCTLMILIIFFQMPL